MHVHVWMYVYIKLKFALSLPMHIMITRLSETCIRSDISRLLYVLNLIYNDILCGNQGYNYYYDFSDHCTDSYSRCQNKLCSVLSLVRFLTSLKQRCGWNSLLVVIGIGLRCDQQSCGKQLGGVVMLVSCGHSRACPHLESDGIHELYQAADSMPQLRKVVMGLLQNARFFFSWARSIIALQRLTMKLLSSSC